MKVFYCECGCGSELQPKPHHFWQGRTGPRFLIGHSRKGIGRGLTENMGYLRITRRGDPNKGRYVHCLVMEGKLGRNLKKGEIVHHINGNKKDNRPENLELTTVGEHIRGHWKDEGFRDFQVKRLTKLSKKRKRGKNGRFT